MKRGLKGILAFLLAFTIICNNASMYASATSIMVNSEDETEEDTPKKKKNK